jgi:hypothetical protein
MKCTNPSHKREEDKVCQQYEEEQWRIEHADNATITLTPKRKGMFASFGLLILTATMAAGEPDVTPYQLQANCEKLAVETFGRETVDDGDRLDYRAHYSGHLKKCQRAETYISLTPVGINTWV